MKKIEMKKGFAKKAVSLLLTASLCASVSSCKTGPDESTTSESPVTVTTTSETTTVTTATETTEATTTETEPTGPFSKSVAYRLFVGNPNSMTIDMNVNIDDYITKDGDKEIFELYRLASDLGWLEKGVYSYDDYLKAIEADPDQTSVGHSNWFEYKYGDHRVVFTISEYIDNVKGFDSSRQVSWISFEYLKNDIGMPYFDDASSNYGHAKTLLGFQKHYGKLCYYVGNRHCVCSRDDAVIIAYGLWYFTINPDDSTAYKQDFAKRFTSSKGITII